MFVLSLLATVVLLAQQPTSERALDEAASAFSQGKTAEAEHSVDLILKEHPTDLRALLLKGAILDSKQRYSEADSYYQRALRVAPNSAQVLNNIGNHFLASGARAEARKFFLKAIALDPHHENAILQLAQMSVDDKDGKQALSYLSRLGDLTNLDLGAVLLRARALGLDGQCSDAAKLLNSLPDQASANPKVSFSTGMTFAQCKLYYQAERSFSRALAADPTNFDILYNLGLAALESGHTERATNVLETALKQRPEDADCQHALGRARLDLAVVRFQLQGPQAALSELDKIPPADRKGDYYLLRAQILDSLNQMQEAVDALNRGIRAAPARPDLYLQAAGFLLKHNLLHEALDLLEQASRILPDARELLLAQVVTLQLLRREDDAQNLVSRIQTRWPGWDRAYALKGMLLEIQLKSAEARRTLEKAIALGANTPEAYYYEALAITHTDPGDLDGAEAAITHALALTSTDPYIIVLAGKIALAKKDYAKALQFMLAATRLQPTLIPAHYGLRDVYKALGNEQKSVAEMEEIKRLAHESSGADQNPFSTEGFLFAVRPPS
ncbi:MAG: tetratricopeptide repeat protein [Acidobacteriaceae bacterium]|nr:tetratricopeptide repeat protein [Acidobacteriaceae bacterium]